MRSLKRNKRLFFLSSSSWQNSYSCLLLPKKCLQYVPVILESTESVILFAWLSNNHQPGTAPFIERSTCRRYVGIHLTNPDLKTLEETVINILITQFQADYDYYVRTRKFVEKIIGFNEKLDFEVFIRTFGFSCVVFKKERRMKPKRRRRLKESKEERRKQINFTMAEH